MAAAASSTHVITITGTSTTAPALWVRDDRPQAVSFAFALAPIRIREQRVFASPELLPFGVGLAAFGIDRTCETRAASRDEAMAGACVIVAYPKRIKAAPRQMKTEPDRLAGHAA